MTDQSESRTALLRRVFYIAGSALLVMAALSALFFVLGPLLFQTPEDLLRWQAWRAEHNGYLLAWRLTLYGALLVAWLKLKAHLRLNTSSSGRKQVRRIEILMFFLLLLIEMIKATW